MTKVFFVTEICDLYIVNCYQTFTHNADIPPHTHTDTSNVMTDVLTTLITNLLFFLEFDIVTAQQNVHNVGICCGVLECSLKIKTTPI